MEQYIELSQKQGLAQHMIQSMEILQMNALELESYLENLALENPVMELDERSREDIPAQQEKQEELQRKLDWLESTDLQNRVYYQQERGDDSPEDNWHDQNWAEESLSDYLLSQILLSGFSGQDRSILKFMILSLDERGYYPDELSVAAEAYHVDVPHIERLLKVIQSLNPAGIGARSLEECLLLQIERGGSTHKLTEAIIKNHLNDIARNHLPHIAKKLNASMEEVTLACEEIRRLQPKPGSAFYSRNYLQYITPDVIIVTLEGSFEILINEYKYPGFHISSYYQDMHRTIADKEAKAYLHEKIRQARWVSSCIEQRASTLARVMHELVQLQNDFFLRGTGYKRPMKLSDLADKLNLHESTVSRALHGKYLQCHWGIFPLNYFLTCAAGKAAGTTQEKTPEQVKALIQTIVDGEDKQNPYSDQAISEKLLQHDIHISRRTVNKYRGEMNLPDKNGRKIWG